MTAHDALTTITQILNHPLRTESPDVALWEIQGVLDQCQPLPFTTTLPTQPGWYVHKSTATGFLYCFEIYPTEDGLTVKMYDQDTLVERFDAYYGAGQWKGPLDLEAL